MATMKSLQSGSIIGSHVAAVLALLTAPGAHSQPEAPPPADCEPSRELVYVCGPRNAEDIVALGDSQWLIVSGMSVQGQPPSAQTSGRLYLVDARAKTFETWFPAESVRMDHDTEAFGTCPGALNVANFSAHGLAIREVEEHRYKLYMTSHGEREAIEVFDVESTGSKPTIAWRGCVVLPERTSSNSVVILSDGGFLTTKMMDPTDPAGFAGILAGKVSGNVYEWHPGGAVTAVIGTELSGANGIELSPDERWLYVAAIGSREIVRFDRAENPVTKTSVTVDIMPDNLRWTDDGTLYTVGGSIVDPGGCTRAPCLSGWTVLEIDPDTLEATRVEHVGENDSLQGASTALAVGDEIWIGTFRGDRVGVLPRPEK